ncbi:EF-hand domain-containing member C2, partial [Cladochytrium tenue]
MAASREGLAPFFGHHPPAGATTGRHTATSTDFSGAARELEKALPFLPGHSFNFDRINASNHRKSHTFDYCNTVAVFKGEAPGIGGKPLHGQDKVKVHTSVEMYKHATGDNETLPTWVAFDRKVLRFYAYFQEAVHEMRDEQYRVRKVNIYFYLEDDTIHVSEPKVPDSGIPQGTLIRRHRIPKKGSENGQHYTIADLNVDKEVTFYSRTFKIVGCDEFTRDFLNGLGIPVPSPSAFPSNPYDERRGELLSRMKPTRPCPPKTSLKRFLENDRRVLRFFCVWDDTDSVFGDLRHMVLHYYLSDDTIDIHERIPPNSGREPNTLFLRRCRLPKKQPTGFYGQLSVDPDDDAAAAATAAAATAAAAMAAAAASRAVVAPTPASPTDAYFTERDLVIGAVLHLYDRPFVICDCDEFTKDYYRENYGLDSFDPVRLDAPATAAAAFDAAATDATDLRDLVQRAAAGPHPAGAAVAAATPASAASLQLLGGPADAAATGGASGRPTSRKLTALDGVVLRFAAALATGRAVDRDRRFVVSLFPADGAVAVFEPRQRNSGVLGGKFLERMRVRRPGSDACYGSADFFV